MVGKPPFMSPLNQNMLTFVESMMLKKQFYGNKLITHMEPVDNFVFLVKRVLLESVIAQFPSLIVFIDLFDLVMTLFE